MNAKILRLWAATMVLGLAACGDGSDAPAPVGDGGGAKWFTYERAEAYPGVAQISGLKITMADGIELSASVALPADASGNTVARPDKDACEDEDTEDGTTNTWVPAAEYNTCLAQPACYLDPRQDRCFAGCDSTVGLVSDIIRAA